MQIMQKFQTYPYEDHILNEKASRTALCERGIEGHHLIIKSYKGHQKLLVKTFQCCFTTFAHLHLLFGGVMKPIQS